MEQYTSTYKEISPSNIPEAKKEYIKGKRILFKDAVFIIEKAYEYAGRRRLLREETGFFIKLEDCVTGKKYTLLDRVMPRWNDPNPYTVIYKGDLDIETFLTLEYAHI